VTGGLPCDVDLDALMARHDEAARQLRRAI
jgi:8-oxoguanine deaminase